MEQIIKMLERCHNGCPCVSQSEIDLIPVIIEHLNDYVKLRAEIADGRLVRVVKCKDCRYWRESEKTNRAFCEYDTAEINMERYASDSCNYGERREAALAAQEVQP